jgi:hypothetical protein
MAEEYGAHAADLVQRNEAAQAWAEQSADLLFTQLDAVGLDGLTLSGLIATLVCPPPPPASRWKKPVYSTK